MKQIDKIIENTIKSYITENITDELNVFHGTDVDFKKFNHKKFLGKGAGSQSFGWGTYVTDDDAVAQGYRRLNQKESDETSVEYIYKGEKISYSKLFSILCNMVYKVCPQIVEFKRVWYVVDEFIVFFVKKKDLQKVKEIYQIKLEKYIQKVQSDEKLYGFMFEYDILFLKTWLQLLNTLQYDLKINEETITTNAYKYEVTIPDDNGYNYLSWYNILSNQQMSMIFNGLLTLKDNLFKNVVFSSEIFSNIAKYLFYARKIVMYTPNMFKNKTSNILFSFSKLLSKTKFLNIYYMFTNALGSQKAASMFFMHCGFDGIKYPAGTRWKAPENMNKNAMNYVIFDANKAQIQNKTTYKNYNDEVGVTTKI